MRLSGGVREERSRPILPGLHFYPAVLDGAIWMYPQKVSKKKIVAPEGRSPSDDCEVRVVGRSPPQVLSPGDVCLAQIFVPEAFQDTPVGRCEWPVNGRHEDVDDGFRCDAGHGGAAKVLHFSKLSP